MARTASTVEETPAVEGEVATTWYVVLHNCVARWWQGQTISDKHLEGHDIDRLVALGAIAPVGSEAHVVASKDGLAELTPDSVQTSAPVPLPEKPVLPASSETSTPSSPFGAGKAASEQKTDTPTS